MPEATTAILPPLPPAPAAFLYAKPEGVEITLAGKPHTLRYTLGASRQVTAHFGEYPRAFQGLWAFDVSAFVAVVALGIGDEAVNATPDFENEVFKAGMDSLVKPLTEYLAWLSNGGRKPTPIGANQAAPGNV